MQHQVGLGGKCGICGDPYDGIRKHEAGGEFTNGIITRNYVQNGVMEVAVELTGKNCLGTLRNIELICSNNYIQIK